MRILKLAIGISVMLLILFLAFNWMRKTEGVKREEVKAGGGDIEKSINTKLDSFFSLPDSVLAIKIYTSIKLEIEEDAKFGLFNSKDSISNRLTSDNLRNKLFRVYAKKYLRLANWVFNNGICNNQLIQILRTENTYLIGSPLIGNAATRDSLNYVLQTIKKLDQINSFLVNANNWKFDDIDINVDYDSREASDFIQKSSIYLDDSGFPYNCSEIRGSLERIPDLMLKKEEGYFVKKIKQLSVNEYPSLSNTTFSYYVSDIKRQFFKKNIYNVDYSEISSIKSKLTKYLNNIRKIPEPIY
jgi:hypothetical protein